MAVAEMHVAACPACVALPAPRLAETVGVAGDVALSLPGIHCAGCIAGVERALMAVPGVRAARVNLTLKRAQVKARGVEAAALVAALTAAGYEAHELDAGTLAATGTDRAGRALLARLAVAGFAMMNVMLLSVSVWSGAEDATRDLFHWISAAITLPAVAFAAQPFLVSAWGALRGRRLNMDVPISLAILLALATSVWETALSGQHAYFDAAISLTFFLLAGRYLDHRTRAIARSAAEELTALEVPRAWRVEAGRERQVPVADLAPGDVIRVRPGGRMPADGVIVAGVSDLDRSLLTGESVPVPAAVGLAVSAGEVNLSGPLDVAVTAAGADSSLHRMAQLVAIAESGRSRYTALADRAARLYAPGVHVLAALAAAGWFLWTGDLRLAVGIAAAVLIITCPCALGLAVPAVTTAASGRLFRQGMLIKHHTALERLAQVDTVVFDKTGTLTTGVPEVALDGIGAEVLSVARALAEGSDHPLSRALAAGIGARGIAAAAVSDRVELPGQGAQAVWQGQRVRLGRADWVGGALGDTPGAGTAAWLRIGPGAPVALRFTETLRPGAADAVAALQAQGIGVRVMSGDSAQAVGTICARIGVDDWLAGVSPGDKAARIAEMQARGSRVLMVGDGLNDTAALTQADVSISPASALDAARVASDIVLLGGDLAPVAGAIGLARVARRRITQNFRIASAYNVVAVPLAVAGLATPLIAALAMSASSITVSLNALRLGRR